MAMQKISFYDVDTDTMMEVELSEEDAVRAQNDTIFATSIVQRIRATDEDPVLQRSESLIAEKEMNTDKDDSGSLYRWTESSVLLLLNNYRTVEKSFSDGGRPQKKLWEEIACEMVKHGNAVTGTQCAAKLRSLKKSYKSIKDHNNKSGNNRRTWQFFDVMDGIFSKKTWCSPVATASSTGQSSNCIDTSSAAESDNVCLDNGPSAKKKCVMKLLEKRIEQKDKHENARERRHREGMEMDYKLLSLLKKIVEKE